MAMASGSRIGHYEILGTLGAGGMGEVYRARDTKLDRDVALKILPDAFASDAERRARFGREAKTLASLNHPNIAHIHGLEESGATSALVMELVEGEDLSARIRRGPIPYDEAVAIAKQIAQALEAAHEQGIIHRDLKPANIKIRDDGTIKVLDFGLAKALDQGSGIRDQGSGLANSPTITSPAGVTLGGVILGTAAYMSPEQAKGRAVDRRADIWAFGCVLYEMLTGRRAFGGEDVSDTLASVLKSDVDWTGVPRPATRLLKKCLEKDPKRRLHDIGDAWDLIDDGVAVSSSTTSRIWIPWAIAALLLLVSTLALGVMHFTEERTPPASVRFSIGPPEKYNFDIYLSLSPDGRHLAFTTIENNGRLLLWVRDFDKLDARPLDGAGGARSPFWSPDSRYLAFAEGRALKRVDVNGGPAITIGESTFNVGVGAWGANGDVLFGTRGNGPIHRVSESGGNPVGITSVDASRGETGHSFPFFLPDGRRFLYFRQSNRAELTGIYVGSLDLAPEQQDLNRLTAATGGPVFVTTGPEGSRLLFFRAGTLMAQAFDVDSLELSRDPAAIAEQVGSSGAYGFFSATVTDVLAFRKGPASTTTNAQLTWFGRDGKQLGTVGDALALAPMTTAVAIQPKGEQVALAIALTPNPSLWMLELRRGLITRFTSNAQADTTPVWAGDGYSCCLQIEPERLGRSVRQGSERNIRRSLDSSNLVGN